MGKAKKRSRRRSTRSRRRRTSKKSYRRRRRTRRRLAIALPNKYVCRMRYSEEFSLNPGANGVASYVYSANGVYDPRIAVGGHQPLGYDNMALHFRKMTVIGSKIHVRPILADSSYETAAQMYTFILVSSTGTDSSIYTDIDNMLEVVGKNRVRHTGAYYTKAGNGDNLSSMTATWSPKKWVGSKRILEDSEYATSTSANPTRQYYYEVCGAAIGGNDPTIQQFRVTIEYIVVCTEPYPKLLS